MISYPSVKDYVEGAREGDFGVRSSVTGEAVLAPPLEATAPVLAPAYNTSPKLFVAILRALEAIRARPRFKDAYKAAARIGESVRKLPI